MKKSIGLLIPSMYSGGAERVVSRLSYILSEDYYVHVIMYEDTYKQYECCGNIINLGIKSNNKNKVTQKLLPFRRAIKLRRVKEKYGLNTVISFLDSPNIVNILSQGVKCKKIISIRNYSYHEKSNLANALFRYFYQKADYVISVSKVITNQMISDFRIDPNKVFTIYNPYDTEQINSLASHEPDEEHKEFFCDGFIFISVGRIVHQKGFWHLVKAFKIAHDQCPEAKLVIIGKDELQGKTQKLAKDLGLEDSVLFIGFHENPFKYIYRSNIYVLSSLFEGFPNVLVEAMACGLPVIAADCKSGPREILYRNPKLDEESTHIERADFGLLVKPLNAEENWDPFVLQESDRTLAEAMLMTIEDKDMREFYARVSPERAKDFSYEVCKKKYKALID